MKPDFRTIIVFDGSKEGARPIAGQAFAEKVVGRNGPPFPLEMLVAAGVYDPNNHFVVIKPRGPTAQVSDIVSGNRFVRSSGVPDFSALKGWSAKKWVQGMEKGDVVHYVLVNPQGKAAAYQASFHPRFNVVGDVIVPAMKVFGTIAGGIGAAVNAASSTAASAAVSSGLESGSSNMFDSFDFSFGESWSQASDAQTIDFGFNDMTVDFGLNDIPSWQFEPTSLFESAPQVANAVGESPVSWFGNVDYGFPDVNDFFQTAKDSIQLAGEAAKTVYSIKNLYGNAAGSASGAKTIAQAKPSTSGLTSNRALQLQQENAQQRDFVGQLIGLQNPDGSVNWGSIALLAGGAIVLYAVAK